MRLQQIKKNGIVDPVLFIRRFAQISADYFEKDGDSRGGAESAERKRTGMGDLKRGRLF
jgi:hypothetical protein